MSITLRSDFDVELVQSAGSDEMICQAARVSTVGAESLDTVVSEGLINFLLKNRHGTPFEHGMLTFRISAPIFVWREFMRHRIGFSYNEESGRYKVLDSVFYAPPLHRPLVQEGKPGAYSFRQGDSTQHRLVSGLFETEYNLAWSSYIQMIDQGIAKEVARMVLPVGTYSTAYVTCNPRSLMAFLSLRTKDDKSLFLSYPQWEIEQVADQLEYYFGVMYPLTYKAYNKNGRVSP